MQTERNAGGSSDQDGAKEFGRWKARLNEAIGLDTRLSTTARLIAVHLLAFANRQTRQINPSQWTLSQRVGVKERTVKAAIKSLRDHGWLRTTRPDKRFGNYYFFLDDQVEGLLQRRYPTRANRHGDGMTPSPPTGNGAHVKHGSILPSSRPPEGKRHAPPTGIGSPPNTSELTQKGTRSDSALERSKTRPYVSPEESLDKLLAQQTKRGTGLK